VLFLPVICIDASDAKAVLKMQSNKRVKLVEGQMNLDLYVQRLAGFLNEGIKSGEGP
jgi:hypothetical protein